MASLTPGVLLKLLQSMNADSPKVTGEHRSAVLQVIGIVPAPPAPGDDDLWPARGFYLQLSDSVHSTYVSLPDPDANAILSSRPQLGQLVHLDRLHFALPVPLASGLRTIPRVGPPHPFVGRPEPLVARFSPDHRGFVIQPALDAAPLLDPPQGRQVFAPKENLVANTAAADPTPKRRFSSPAARKIGIGGVRRDPSPSPVPAVTANKAGSRPSSPVPSKCDVPSLVAAKEEHRRASREPAIVVPSRYRQPSPVGRKAPGASPAGRRSSMSPGRRLSGGLKVSPAVGEGKKRVAAVVAGISRVSDALVGSARSVRRSWEDPGTKSGESSEAKETNEKVRNHKGVSKNKVDQQAILRTQLAMTRRWSDASGGNSNDDEQSVNEKPRANHKSDCSSTLEKSHPSGPKIVVYDKKWTDGSIPFDSLSDNLARLGKESLQRRNTASAAAAQALEEAWAIESVIRSLSMFSDLCSSSKTGNPLPTIDRFLSIYNDVIKCNAIVGSLSSSIDGHNDAVSIERHISVSMWVEAALATDLGVITLLNDGPESLSRIKNSEKSGPQSIDPPRTSFSKRYSTGTPPSKNNAKVVTTSSTANTWIKGCGMIETSDVARLLRSEMQNWFLKFVEEAVDMGFRLFGDHADDSAKASFKDRSKITAVLSHLKRVNEWLDGVGRRKPEEEQMKEIIERLKRKIFGFVISHVGSAFDSSVSLSKP